MSHERTFLKYFLDSKNFVSAARHYLAIVAEVQQGGPADFETLRILEIVAKENLVMAAADS